MSPTPDKIRPWRTMHCRDEDCEFTTRAEWEALRHEKETGHFVNWRPDDPDTRREQVR